jgi:hypothetical protein
VDLADVRGVVDLAAVFGGFGGREDAAEPRSNFERGLYLWPGTDQQLREAGLTAPKASEDRWLDVADRKIHAAAVRSDLVWFDFAELCATPTSTVDYLALAEDFPTWVISGLPVSTPVPQRRRSCRDRCARGRSCRAARTPPSPYRAARWSQPDVRVLSNHREALVRRPPSPVVAGNISPREIVVYGMQTFSALRSECRYVITATGERIGYDMCFASDCMRPLSRCTCPDGPTPPHLGPDAGPLVAAEATIRPAA